MKVTRIAVLSVLFLSSYVLASSQITFSLGLQAAGAGSDYADYVSQWKNPTTNCQPVPFVGGSTTSFPVNSVITWDARVQVSGAHSNGFVPSGVANIVFNLELQQDTGGGTWVTLPFPAGSLSPNVAGWFSMINDGTSGTRQTTCGKGPDTRALAAATVSYTFVAGKNGRIIDQATDGGPYVDYYQYPSAAGFPTNSTAPTGKLLGCGAGYSKYHSVADPGGLNTAGVGVASGSASCAAALGTGPVFEGQMNTTGLAAGNYRLVLTPGTGCNILDGSFNCLGADPGKFALKPDLASQGATMNFTLMNPITPVNITAWRSLKTHSGAGELAITLNAAATATGQTAGGIKVESRNSSTQNGITKIQVDFDAAVSLVDQSKVTVTGAKTTGCSSSGTGCVMGTVSSYTPSSVTMSGAQTMTIAFANGALADDGCYIISIADGALDKNINGDRDCKVRMLQADSTGDGYVNTIDMAQIKSRIGQPITVSNCVSDQNLTAGVNTLDMAQAKSRLGKRALCP